MLLPFIKAFALNEKGSRLKGMNERYQQCDASERGNPLAFKEKEEGRDGGCCCADGATALIVRSCW